MQELVALKGKDAFTDSLIISSGTGVAHGTIIIKSAAKLRKIPFETISGQRVFRLLEKRRKKIFSNNLCKYKK